LSFPAFELDHFRKNGRVRIAGLSSTAALSVVSEHLVKVLWSVNSFGGVASALSPSFFRSPTSNT
jgi:hypothetical protein